jgi:ferredoxin
MSEILHTAGIRFTAASGDAGAGGLCRLRVEKGKVNQPTSAELTQFLQDELREGVRLACQVRPLENARIRIEATPAAGEAL